MATSASNTANDMTVHRQHIKHQRDLPRYSPQGHTGTTNIRLFDRQFCENFEMVLGDIEPGGIADRHSHDIEHQAMYVLNGIARVTLGDDAPVECSAGSIIELPPGVEHVVESLGPENLKLVIVYSPPLPLRADVPHS